MNEDRNLLKLTEELINAKTEKKIYNADMNDKISGAWNMRPL